MAKKNERGEDRGGLVEDFTAAREGDEQAVAPARADCDGDEHHHVQGARPQGAPGTVEEDPRRVEDHRQAQEQSPHVVPKPEGRRNGESEDLSADGRPQQDRHGQQRGNEESVAHVRDHVGHGHAAVTAVPHDVMG